jgi:hypothetical protein
MIWRGSGVTFLAVKLLTQHVRSTGLRGHPRPFDPRRVVANMLEVATGQFSHPVTLFVLVEARNGLFHDRCLDSEMRRYLARLFWSARCNFIPSCEATKPSDS